MLGLPGDTREKDIETTRKSISMNPDICRIYPSLVIKETPMEKLLREGLYKPYTLEEAVDISKIVYGMMEGNDIKVIRIGLQPTEEISADGDVVDGPFHPAFRELVESSVYCDMIYDYYKDKEMDKFKIYINPKDISKLYSNKKQYFNLLLKKLKSKEIFVTQERNIGKSSIGFYNGTKLDIINQKDYLKLKYQ